MKKISILLCIFAIAVFSFGCEKNESPENMLTGEWVLEEVGSTWTQEVMKAEEIDYEETYVFHRNGTFLKTRTGSDSEGQATGTFTHTEPDNQDVQYYLLLTFETGTDLIASCTKSLGIEEFGLLKNGTLLNAAGACDWPILTYRKK